MSYDVLWKIKSIIKIIKQWITMSNPLIRIKSARVVKSTCLSQIHSNYVLTNKNRN